jgi:hypothetical protein
LGHADCSFVIAQSPEPLLRVEVEVFDSTNKPPSALAHNGGAQARRDLSVEPIDSSHRT